MASESYSHCKRSTVLELLSMSPSLRYVWLWLDRDSSRLTLDSDVAQSLKMEIYSIKSFPDWICRKQLCRSHWFALPFSVVLFLFSMFVSIAGTSLEDGTLSVIHHCTVAHKCNVKHCWWWWLLLKCICHSFSYTTRCAVWFLSYWTIYLITSFADNEMKS